MPNPFRNHRPRMPEPAAIPNAARRRPPAVFIDRDDTLCENSTLPDAAFTGTPGDLFDPAWVRLLPGAVAACTRLAGAGHVLVVITNQACHARGHADLRRVEATNDRVRALIGRSSAGRPLIAATYAAPHHPSAAASHLRRERAHAGGPWRKPGPGMILAAAAELGLDLGQSWVIGDKPRDAEAGYAAGLDPERCLVVRAPGAPKDAEYPHPWPLFDDFPAAAAHVLGDRAAVSAQQQPVVPASVTPAAMFSLRAGRGTPLADAAVRRIVLAAARAIAERTGVEIISLDASNDTVRAAVASSRLAAMGFAAELRRATNRWHAGRTGEPLWPDGPAGPSTDDGDSILGDGFFDGDPGPSSSYGADP